MEKKNTASKEKRKRYFNLMFFCLGVYSLLCTVYSDIIVQNGNSWLSLPYQSISEVKFETTFPELIEHTKKDEQTDAANKEKSSHLNNLYVFVIDISGSYINGDLTDKLAKSYNDRLSLLQEKIKYQLENRKPNRRDFIKLRLYEFLVDLKENKSTELDNEFAIWILGNEGKQKFPEFSEKASVSTKSIEKAIEIIAKLPASASDNTDFVSLFRSLQYHYKMELINRPKSVYETPTVIITFLTDLLHDVDNKKMREIDRNWEELEEKVQQFCNSKIMINMIISSDEDLDNHRTIFPLFRDNIEWYQLNKYLIGEEKNSDFLYPICVNKKSIKFYHTNPDYVENAMFVMKSTSSDANKLRISIPTEIISVPVPKVGIYCETLGAEGDTLDYGKKILTGGGSYEVEVKKNQQIKLQYSGRLPSNLSVPILKISSSTEKKSFLIPIKFIKRLPEWGAIIFILVQLTFMVISALFLLLLINSKTKGLQHKLNQSKPQRSNEMENGS